MPCGRFGGACAPFAPLGSGTDFMATWCINAKKINGYKRIRGTEECSPKVCNNGMCTVGKE